jgi:phage terminase large subunit GpA-like protein
MLSSESGTAAAGAFLWSESARRVWHWRERLPPSVWCEQNLVIPNNGINPHPGPYSFSVTPWWREIIDLIFHADTRQVWAYKATQVGWTRLMINVMCYAAAHPELAGGLGLLMPDEDSVHDIFSEEIQPTIDQSETMRAHKTGRAWDETKGEIWLDTMPIFGLYAGSVQRLARRTLRMVIGDEIDKYRPFRHEASPIRLLLKRTDRWNHLARALFGSSPSTPEGNICQGYQACVDKRHYFVPCPHCGQYQQIDWTRIRGLKQAKGDTKFERAQWVIENRPCYYECEHCQQPIAEAHKPAMAQVGRWVSGLGDGIHDWKPVQTVDESGNLHGERPRSENIAVHMPAYLAVDWNKLAAEFIEAEGDIDKTRDFENARKARPFQQRLKSIRPSVIRDKRDISPLPIGEAQDGGPVSKVPKWVLGVYATVDTQKDWFALAIRGWGWGYRSQLLYHGTCYTFDEVYERGLACAFPTEEGSLISPKVLLIDSGYHTDQVYEFSRRDIRIVPVKGGPDSMRKNFQWTEPTPGVRLLLLNVNHYKSALDSLIHDHDATKWLTHRLVSEQYCMEMASEELVTDPRSKRPVWIQRGGRNEAWDLETYQRAAAEIDGIGAAPAPTPELVAQPIASAEQYVNPLTSYKGRW